jgi:hypothetical protein
MRWVEPDPLLRTPGAVDDLDADPAVPQGVQPVPVLSGMDTDGDGVPDTVVTVDGADLLLHTDLDADGLADQVLRLGPDAGFADGAAGADPGRPSLGWWWPGGGTTVHG